MMRAFFGAANEVVSNNVGAECHDCNAEAREHVLEHGSVREDWMSAPCFPFSPGVFEEFHVRHGLYSLRQSDSRGEGVGHEL